MADSQDNTFTMVFHGEPVAKGRARAVSFGGRARLFTPAKTRAHEAALKFCAQQEMDGRPLFVGPISMSIVATFPVPASWSNVRRLKALNGKILPAKRPDLSNVVKAVEDALNCVVYQDDAQICFSMYSKVYGEQPSIRVEVHNVAAANEFIESGEIAA